MSTVRRSVRERRSVNATLNESYLGVEEGDSDHEVPVAAAESDADAGTESDNAPEPQPKRRSVGSTGTGAAAGRGRPAGSATKPKSAAVRKPAGRPRGSVGSSSNTDNNTSIVDDTAEEEASNCALYHSVARSSSALKSIVRDWLDAYEIESSSDLAIAELVNFLIQSCGSIASFDVSEIINRDRHSIVTESASSDQIVNGESPVKRIKKFQSRLMEFFIKLINSARSGPLYDGILIETILNWLTALSSSTVRMFRYTATLATIALITACIEVAKIELDELNNAKSQLELLQSKSSNSKAIQSQLSQLESSINEHQLNINKLHDYMKLGFDSIFVHRYRDVDPTIRSICLESLGNWLLNYSQYWLKDSYLKYIGWTLNDKDTNVRLASLRSILNIYQSASAESIAKLDVFTNRFLKRFQSMCKDIDDNVAAAAIQLMTCLLKVGILSENDGESIPTLIWEDSILVRSAAVQFVYEDTFADSAQQHSIESHQQDLIQLLNIFDQYAPIHSIEINIDNNNNNELTEEEKYQRRSILISRNKLVIAQQGELKQPITVLVQGFWNKLEALKDWQAITKALFATEATSKKGKKSTAAASTSAAAHTHERQLTLSYLLLAAAQLATGHSIEQLELIKQNKQTKADQQLIETSTEELTSQLIPILPKLLTVFQADYRTIKVLIQLPQLINLSTYSSQRKKKEFTELLKVIKSIYLKHSDPDLLAQASSTLNYLSRELHEFREEAITISTELATELIEQFNNITADNELDIDNTDQLLIVIAVLKRIHWLHRLGKLKQLNWSLNPKFELLLKLVLSNANRAEQYEIIDLLIQIHFYEIIWQKASIELSNNNNTDQQQQQSVDIQLVHRLAQQMNHLVQRLEFILHDSQSIILKDTAFRLLSDLFYLFSGKYSHSTIYKEWAIPQGRLTSIQAVYDQYCLSLIEGTDSIERAELAGNNSNPDIIAADVRLAALQASIHPIVFDTNIHTHNQSIAPQLRHHQLAAIVLSNYHRFGPEEDTLIKYCMSKLKESSSALLLQAQLASLKYLFDNKIRTVEEIKDLSLKFVLVHPLKAESRSFIGFLKSGISYSITDLPNRLQFLDTIIPFVQRASDRDIIQVKKHFDHCYQLAAEQRAGVVNKGTTTDWGALKRFNEALEKKLSGKSSKASTNTISSGASVSSTGTGTGAAAGGAGIRTPASAARSVASSSGESSPSLALTPFSRRSSGTNTPISNRARTGTGPADITFGSALSPVSESESAAVDQSIGSIRKRGRPAASTAASIATNGSVSRPKSSASSVVSATKRSRPAPRYVESDNESEPVINEEEELSE